MTRPSRRATKTISFRGAPGNVVRQVHSGSPNIIYDGLNLDAGGAKTTGAVFENGGGDNNTFRNGPIGNVVDEKAALVDGSTSPSTTCASTTPSCAPTASTWSASTRSSSRA